MLVLSPVCGVYAASIGTVDQLVVFGDSLSDDGNALYLENEYKDLTGNYPAGEPVPLPPDYTAGKFTDGPDTTPATTGPAGLWIDQFASKMGMSQPQASYNGGTNYATGSAQTGLNSSFPLGVPYVGDQLALFTTSHLSGIPADDLYIFWAGADDIFAGGNGAAAANNIANYISSLSSLGAKYFLWLNLPGLNSSFQAFDAQYATDLARLQAGGTDVVGVDVNALFAAILANPAQYGFTDVTDPAWCGVGALPNCAANDPNDFLLWDGTHPTTAADALVAQLAYDDVAGLPAGATVPEPADVALASIGLGALLLFKKQRSKTINSRRGSAIRHLAVGSDQHLAGMQDGLHDRIVDQVLIA
jgi:thermolabile hemolysin